MPSWGGVAPQTPNDIARRTTSKCDSTSQALDWIKSGSTYDGFFKWLESEADKAKKGTFGANHVLPPCPACQSKSVSDIGPQFR
jgi:hypothetical protein